MHSARSVLAPALLALLLAAPLLTPASAALARQRRQLADDDALQPLQEAGATADEPAGAREKRKLEAATQAKFGIKNALLGFVFGSGSTWARRSSGRAARQAASTTTEDPIPTFDRNKVSLDFPGNLFGPSVSLLIRTTKVAGDVIQNSAVRYQSFLRLFRGLFRGQFEIKGLDPPTTTTTAPSPADNEVRRRRGLSPL